MKRLLLLTLLAIPTVQAQKWEVKDWKNEFLGCTRPSDDEDSIVCSATYTYVGSGNENLGGV